jgi:lysozyme family protein
VTAANFGPSLKVLLGVEGGVSNRPLADDPGGLTNKGITQAIYDRWRAANGLPQRSVRLLTSAEQLKISKAEFWDVVHADDLPSGIDAAVFDYSFHSGPSRAIRDLQRTLGVKVDGILGSGSMAALKTCDASDAINELCDRRLRYKNGWPKRVAHVRAFALDLASDGETDVVAFASAPEIKENDKAFESRQAQLKTADGAGLSATTVGGLGQTAMERAQELQPHIGDTILGRAAIAGFVLLMVFGLALLAYAQLRRVKEKGGLGGYLGSMLKT